MAVQLEEAQREAAAAKSQAASTVWRNALLEKAWTAALEDSKMLQLKKRSLESALAQSQREAFALAAQLERASALADELEAAQEDASVAKKQASSARARIALLEKAWTAALEDARQLKHTAHRR